jgi:ornithine carbamoyltransferase
MEKKRDFLSLFDVSDAEFASLIRRAEELRFLRQMREPHASRPGRMLALIFEKASTRTRVSFERQSPSWADTPSSWGATTRSSAAANLSRTRHG